MEVSEFIPLPRCKPVIQDAHVTQWRLILIAEELDAFFDVKGASNR
jgi:hypothetical protein